MSVFKTNKPGREHASWARAMLVGSAFVGFFAGAWLLSWIVLPPLKLFVRNDDCRVRLCQELVQRAFVLFHAYMRMLRLIDFDPAHNRLHLRLHRETQPAVIIANHPTLVDVTAIIAVLGQLCCVVKGPLFTSPLTGPLLRACGHILCHSSDLNSSIRTLQEAEKRLRSGHNVLFFPEGSRSPPGEVGPFHHGAFAVAQRVETPIRALFVHVDPPALIKGVPWYKFPQRLVRMRLYELPPLPAPSTATSPRKATRTAKILGRCHQAHYKELVEQTKETDKNTGEMQHKAGEWPCTMRRRAPSHSKTISRNSSFNP